MIWIGIVIRKKCESSLFVGRASFSFSLHIFTLKTFLSFSSFSLSGSSCLVWLDYRHSCHSDLQVSVLVLVLMGY